MDQTQERRLAMIQLADELKDIAADLQDDIQRYDNQPDPEWFSRQSLTELKTALISILIAALDRAFAENLPEQLP